MSDQGQQEETEMTAQPAEEPLNESGEPAAPAAPPEDPRVAQHAAVPAPGAQREPVGRADPRAVRGLLRAADARLRPVLREEIARGAEEARARLSALQGVPLSERHVPRDVESKDDVCTLPGCECVQSRSARAKEARARDWRASVPTKFRQWRLDTIADDQQPGKLRAWFASDSPMLVIASPTVGNGKSSAAYALGWAAYEAGLWVHARMMADLVAALRPTEEYEPEAWPTVSGCDLLIIDELGAERLTDWTIEQTRRLLDVRWRERRRTVITTNKTSEEIEREYGAAIADRLIDDAVAVKFTGKSKRRARSW
jgi:DNA replication protein DnaC